MGDVRCRNSRQSKRNGQLRALWNKPTTVVPGWQRELVFGRNFPMKIFFNRRLEN